MRQALVVALILTIASSASAEDLCQAIALRDVSGLDGDRSIIHKGAFDTGISQFRVSKSTHARSVCSHGGSCFPVDGVISGDQKVEALKLTNCKVGQKIDSDEEFDYYRLDVIRSKVTPSALKIDDADNRLLQLGLCNACANSAAYFYVTKPASKCAKLTKSALAGNPVSLKALLKLPDFCNR